MGKGLLGEPFCKTSRLAAQAMRPLGLREVCMVSFGSVLFMLVGVGFLVAAYLLAKSKRKQKSLMQRIQEVYADYEKDMEKFRR